MQKRLGEAPGQDKVAEKAWLDLEEPPLHSRSGESPEAIRR